MKSNDFLGNEWDVDCMGCAISNGSMQVPGGFVQKTSYFAVHQDPLIPLPGFFVIGSLRHIRSMSEMQDVEYQEYHEEDGIRYPKVVVIQRPVEDFTVKLTFQQTTMNEKLEAKIFDLPRPEGSQLVQLTQ